MSISAAWVILHGGALGDLVLTLQLALRLVRAQRDASLRLISRVDPGDFSPCQPLIRREPSESAGISWLYGDDDTPPPSLVSAVHGACVLNALSGTDSSVHARLRSLSPRRLLSFDPRPRAGLARHITRQWQTDLEAQGLLFPKCVQQRPESVSLGASAELRTRGRQLLGDDAHGERNRVVIHPGSGGRRKCWPLASFQRVAALLANQAISATFITGPVEAEWWDGATLRELRAAFALIEQPPPNELTALLSGADLFIGNDSGPTHLAALLGTPTIAIFGPTEPALWRPLGRAVQVFAGDPARDAVTWGLSPEQIADAAGAVLSRNA